MLKFNYIFSFNKNRVISANDKQYIYAKEDLKLFNEITTMEYCKNAKNMCVMGRKTWESIPLKSRPLKNRINVIVTRNKNYEIPEDMPNKELIYIINDLKDIFKLYNELCKFGKVFIIGGLELYNEALKYDINDTYYLGVFEENGCDIKNDEFNRFLIFPEVDFKIHKCKSCIKHFNIDARVLNLKNGNYDNKKLDYTMNIYQHVNCRNGEEYQYLNILSDILENGFYTNTRNGQTQSIFGGRMVYDLSTGNIPLLTTKQVYWKTILKELLWFISGSTDNKILQDQKVKIWNGNATKEFIESQNLPYEENDLGPVYGFQWRHFGAEYHDCKTNYTGKGKDQLAWLINEIKTNPNSRRLILNSWNAADIDKMVLPPCHLMVQFNIQQGYLNAQMYQRSGDMFLGVPFNIASYSFLIIMVAHLTGYKPGRLIHILGDCHIYTEHLAAVETQLKRIPYKFPKYTIKNVRNNIDDFKLEDFEVIDYKHYPKISAKMIA